MLLVIASAAVILASAVGMVVSLVREDSTEERLAERIQVVLLSHGIDIASLDGPKP